MVAPIEHDARGIVDPAAAMAAFRLERHPPSSPRVARFVDRYWVVSWDLPAGASHTQRILAHPVVNLVLDRGEARVHGVTTRLDERVLAGRGGAVGVMFRPAGYRPLLGAPLASITDRDLPAGDELDDLAARFDAGEVDALDVVAALDAHLAGRLPDEPQPSEATTRLVEEVAADRSVTRVEALAERAGVSVRQLQRRFADHVGLHPKAVIRRYRLYEAAERARTDAGVDWAALAAELGYSDQPHLARDFAATFGVPPARYARRAAAAAPVAPDPRANMP